MRKHKTVAILILLLTFITNLFNGVAVAKAATEPEVLITELMPNTINVNKADAYEFIELYNNTQSTINAKNYKLIYDYQSSTASQSWDITADVEIPAKTSFVVWVDNGSNSNLTIADFKKTFNLTDSINDKYIIKTPCGGGMINTSPRTIHVQNDVGTEIDSVSYVAADASDENKSAHYKHNTDGTTPQKTIGAPTPCSLSSDEGITENETPSNPANPSNPTNPPVVKNDPPTIKHTPVTQITDSTKDVNISAIIQDDTKVTAAKLYYKAGKDASFNSIDLTDNGSGNYSAIIPYTALWDDKVIYYLEASDGINVTKTEQYTVNINKGSCDDQKQPPLLITELLPDSKINMNGSDAYEFIELYNNSDKAIDLKDYKLHYHYPDDGDDSDLIWASVPDSISIPSGKTLVFWIINGSNNSSTVDDFNKAFNTNLVENKDIVKIYSSGMANSGARGIKIVTNSGINLAKALYNMNGADDTDPDKGIQYYYNPSDPYNEIMKTKVNATPGTVIPDQIPAHRVHIADDTEKPVINIKSGNVVNPNQNFDINAAATDNTSVKTVSLYLKNNTDKDYTKYNLTIGTDGAFHKVINTVDITGKKNFDYYFEASDGTNTAKSDVIHAVIDGANQSPLRLNVDNTYIAKGTASIKASVDTYPSNAKLIVNGQDVTSKAAPDLESSPTFAFDVTGTDVFFKNGVAIDKNILKVFDDTITSWQTISVPVDTTYFKQGKGFKISIHSGTKGSTFDHYTDENNDDFQVKNVRLILPDGRVLRCSGYTEPEKVIDMGDSTGKLEILDCNFTIPDDAYKALNYQWDTTTLKDGAGYNITANADKNTASADVKIDNTAPAITTNMQEKEYKGNFSIEASAADEIAGVKSVSAVLDGKNIILPYKTSSTTINDGKHVLKITAEDNVGNISEQTVNFTTPVENPNTPVINSPADGAVLSGDTANLSATVTDPSKDNMTVKFKKGYKYTAASSDMTVKSGASEYHPADGTVLSANSLNPLIADDGKQVTETSTDKFPYQMFEVKVPKDAGQDSIANLSWKGSSSAGSKIAMYVWNYSTGGWEIVATHEVIDDKEFTMNADAVIKDRVQNDAIKVLVQEYFESKNGTSVSSGNTATSTKAKIPTGNVNDTPTDSYDFTFAWETDTQYYNATYYQHQLDIHNWLLANKDRMKIKYLFHTGDIVDDESIASQWQNADAAYKMLDQAGFPYGVLAGNHDVGHKLEDYTTFNRYFSDSRYSSNPWYGGTYKNNKGHYDLISSNGMDFIMIYMGWGVGDEEIAWVNSVLKQYPNRKAILCFHEYLEVTGGLGEIPKKIHDQIVKPNSNVCMVLSGHYHSSNQVVEQFDDNGDGTNDRTVYEILFDYQDLAEGGEGYIRLMHFDLKDQKIIFRTYSPSLDDYDANVSDFPVSKEEFVVPFSELGLSTREKKISTDYMQVNLYTNNTIAEADNVKSGDTAYAQWNNAPSSSTGWYAEASDAFGGISRSQVNYVTGTASQSGGANSGGSDTNSSSGSSQGNTVGNTSSASNAGTNNNINNIQISGSTADIQVDAANINKNSSNTFVVNDDRINSNVSTVSIFLDADAVRNGTGDMTFKINDKETVTLPISAIDFTNVKIGSKIELKFTVGTNTLKTDVHAVNKVFSFELTADGQSIHSFKNGEAKITITLSDEDLKGFDRSTLGVYYYNDAAKQLELMDTAVNGNVITFTTPHFSQYIIAEKTNGTLVKTGGGIDFELMVQAAAVLIILGMGLLVVYRKESKE